MPFKISVIMPVYNAAPYLKNSIESILNQTFTDFEFIIFNDASTDNSLEVIKSYTDPRIVLIDSPVNTGYVKHLNDGIGIAQGKYIARMDADDIAFPEKLAKQYQYMEANPDVAICGTLYKAIGDKDFNVELPESDAAIKAYLLIECPLAHPTVVIRKSSLPQTALIYDSSYMPAEDYKLWSTFLASSAKLYNIQEILLHYRVHANNISTQKKTIQLKNTARIRSEVYTLLSKKKPDGVITKLLSSQPDLSKGFIAQLIERKKIRQILQVLRANNLDGSFIKKHLNDIWERQAFRNRVLFWFVLFFARYDKQFVNLPWKSRVSYIIYYFKSLVKLKSL